VPIYEYECRACGDELEIIQKMSEGPLRKCPSCGALKLHRKISRSAFHLKGDGWYVTDYAKNGKDKSKEAQESSSKSESSKSETKSETKSESKSSDKSSAGKSKSKKAAGSKSSD
jgi:putative FmdB family regulatory protein